RVSYRGGETPIDHAEAARQLALAAVSSIEGLHGWVGVDLVIDDDERPVIIEINPRPTTSYIGLRRRYPPGALAAAWLSGDAPGTSGSQTGPPRLVRFDASGNVEFGD